MLNVCNQAIRSEPSTCHTSRYQVTILDMQPAMIQWTHMTLYEAVRALFCWSPLLVIPSRCIVIIYTRDIAHKGHNFQLRVSYPHTTLIYFSKPTLETAAQVLCSLRYQSSTLSLQNWFMGSSMATSDNALQLYLKIIVSISIGASFVNYAQFDCQIYCFEEFF